MRNLSLLSGLCDLSKNTALVEIGYTRATAKFLSPHKMILREGKVSDDSGNERNRKDKSTKAPL